MSATRLSFLDYIKEVLEPFDPLIYKSMFGGYGIYKNGIIMAIIADNELYFKADSEAAKYFESCGSEPFMYQGKHKAITMPYYLVPQETLEDINVLKYWFSLAVAAAIKAKNKK